MRIALVSCVLGLCGCQAITGIDELKVDPRYDPDAGQSPPSSGTPASESGVVDSSNDTSEAAVDAPACEGTTFGGHCYFAPTEMGDWVSAKDQCAAKKAHLVVITSAAEQTAVQAVGTGERWIGLSRMDPVPDLTDKSKFEWVDGEPKTYENWFSTEPNDGPCVRMNDTGAWYDRLCEVTPSKPALAAICERD
ncbi:MAG: C-type lectin domain-containing protein [Polyangiales bacterium]